MKTRFALLSLSVAGVLSSSVMAQEVLPSTALMGEQANYLYRELNSMVKGEKPFDASKADQMVANLIATARKIPTTFTADLKGKSSANSRYAASPKVWEDKADFDGHAAKLLQVLEENRSKVQTLDGLKTAYPAINGACNGCHETYRARKS
jgi:cytochrome c556